MEKAKSKIDVAVLLIFFCRDKQFQKVFEAVKEARPSKLYLYQDGAREGRPNDSVGIEKCREICADDQIDWECEVHRFYQTENKGCDPSEFIAQKWMFENEEMGIVLEDDDVASPSFFPFAKELLERYKDDERIAIICGMNNYDVEKSVQESYFFSKRGSIWGWASWKRFVDLWDEHYTWLDDPLALEKVKSYCAVSGDNYEEAIKTATRHRDSGRAHYESILFAAAAQNATLNIVPKYNMISNIGIGVETTHSASDIRMLPRKTQKLLYKKVYDVEFPLTHPKEVKQCKKYDKKYKTNCIERFFLKVEGVIRRTIFRKRK